MLKKVLYRNYVTMDGFHMSHQLKVLIGAVDLHELYQTSGDSHIINVKLKVYFDTKIEGLTTKVV